MPTDTVTVLSSSAAATAGFCTRLSALLSQITAAFLSSAVNCAEASCAALAMRTG